MSLYRSRIYVAGPISLGDQDENVRRGVAAGLELLQAGYAPFIPHLSHYVNSEAVLGTEDYEKWLQLDFSFIRTCSGVLRIPGISPGADREVAFARTLRLPVFYDIPSILATIPTVQFAVDPLTRS